MIKAILFDVDGVLTDGKITYDGKGDELKSFNVKDGQLVKFMQDQGFIFGAISGRSSKALEKRMTELNINFFRQGSKNKGVDYAAFKSSCNLTDEQVAYIGDDVIDLVVLYQAGLTVAPADATDFVKKHCAIITKAKGGEGVLREVIEYLIIKNKLEDKLGEYYSQ